MHACFTIHYEHLATINNSFIVIAACIMTIMYIRPNIEKMSLVLLPGHFRHAMTKFYITYFSHIQVQYI